MRDFRKLLPDGIIPGFSGDRLLRFADAEGMTGSGVMIGTPEYMSPEQAELKDVDSRADIYSLGVVLYEMTSGKVPFEGETALSVAMKHKTERPRDVREINPQVPPGLAAIIAKCMEKSREARFQNTEELVAELDKVERELATGERVVVSKGPGTTKEVTVTHKAKKFAVPAVGLMVLAMAAFLVFKLLPGKGGQPEAGPAVQVPGDKVSPEGPPKEAATKAAIPIEKAPVPAPSSKAVGTKDKGTGAPSTAVKGAPNDQASPTAALPKDADIASASLAQARASAARSNALKAGIDEKTHFFQSADGMLSDAQKAVGQKRYVDARSLFTVSERLFRICQEKAKDEDRLKAFRKYVEGLRKDVDALKPAPVGDKALDAAKEAEKQGKTLQAGKDIETAAKYYIQAALEYQRILASAAAAKGR